MRQTLPATIRRHPPSNRRRRPSCFPPATKSQKSRANHGPDRRAFPDPSIPKAGKLYPTQTPPPTRPPSLGQTSGAFPGSREFCSPSRAVSSRPGSLPKRTRSTEEMCRRSFLKAKSLRLRQSSARPQNTSATKPPMPDQPRSRQSCSRQPRSRQLRSRQLRSRQLRSRQLRSRQSCSRPFRSLLRMIRRRQTPSCPSPHPPR
jgi:hypothetical protein